MAHLRVQYGQPYRPPIHTSFAEPSLSLLREAALSSTTEESVTHRVFRLIVGRDKFPTPLNPSEVHDPFAAKILGSDSPLPLNLSSLMRSLVAIASEQNIFHVAEDGQIAQSEQTTDLRRTFRMAIQLTVEGDPIFITTSKDIDSTEEFLQLMAWDRSLGVFNFYLRNEESWFLAGNSKDALEPDTRGKGPFSGHVNGSPVMKELEEPWTHWHSNDSRITEDAFDPDDPFLQSDFFKGRVKAELLEPIIKANIQLWNRSRVTQLTQQLSEVTPALSPLPFMRQILDTTTINLASSKQVSANVEEKTTFILPLNFFVNDNGLRKVGIVSQHAQLKLKGTIYLKNREDFDFRLVDGGVTWQKGETQFAFLVPTPTAEDIDLLGQLLKTKIIETPFAAALLMVDFPNSIYSLKRKALMHYLPTTMLSAADLTNSFVAAVKQSDKAEISGTAENDFLNNWQIVQKANWQALFQTSIERYLTKVQEALNTQKGYDAIVTLAEYRRFLFRQQPIFEFPLTLPTTKISDTVSPFEMREDATVVSTALFPLEIKKRAGTMNGVA